MGKPKTDLAPLIQEKTLELLLEKEPEEISTRDIAKACGVTATSLYYYYKDKDALFMEVKLGCIEKMHKDISALTAKKISKNFALKKTTPLEEVRAGLEAFRDWAFANPRIALLVMGRMKADIGADSEKLKRYYQSTGFAKEILDRSGIYSKSTLLDASLCIAALWGAIEMALLKRTVPQYWSKRGNIEFTNKMIELILASLTHKNRNEEPRHLGRGIKTFKHK